MLSSEELDGILALQLTIAWAGEALSEPPRLGWWRTDMVDRDGGSALLRDLLPRTWRWATLQVVREAAMLVDRRARAQMAESEEVRTLFHWGFQVDEKLDERLTSHKETLAEPPDVLPFPLAYEDDFDRDELIAVLEGYGGGEHRIVPGGRELVSVPAAPLERARALAAALLPLASEWPAPFHRLGGTS